MPSKARLPLTPGDEYLFMGDALGQIDFGMVGTQLEIGTEFCTERGTFTVTKLDYAAACIWTKYLSPETFIGPTGDVRV